MNLGVVKYCMLSAFNSFLCWKCSQLITKAGHNANTELNKWVSHQVKIGAKCVETNKKLLHTKKTKWLTTNQPQCPSSSSATPLIKWGYGNENKVMCSRHTCQAMVSVHFKHFHCTDLCDKLQRQLSMQKE